VNQQYDQLQVMLDDGSLQWLTDSIDVLLTTGGSFTSTDTLVSDTGVSVVKQQPFQTRDVVELPSGDRGLLGQAVFFERVKPGVPYTVLIVKTIGNGDPFVLGWIDENDDGSPLQIDKPGSFILRPSDNLADEAHTGVWLTVPA
jgi:hypothetical protein